MPSIDENLLLKMVTKYGLDREQVGKHRARLWLKLTQDYNSTTGSSFPKTKMVKKWQNVTFRERGKKAAAAAAAQVGPDISGDVSNPQELQQNSGKDISNCDKDDRSSAATSSPNVKTASEIVTSQLRPYKDNLWSVMDYALRDLYLYLIMKHGLEDITHPRVKSRVWQELAEEFHALIGNCVVIKQEKFTKKWQNWKSYNKTKGMPHPLIQCKDRLDFDVIRAKLRKLREKVTTDKEFALLLSQESDVVLSHFDEKYISQENSANGGENVASSSKAAAQAAAVAFCENLLSNDAEDAAAAAAAAVAFEEETTVNEVTTTGASSSSATVLSKPLDKQIAIKRLKNESEKLRFIVENGRLEQRKLEMEIEMAGVKLEQAKIELALKQQELANLGLTILP